MGDDRERWRQTFEAEQARMWQTLFAHTRDADLAADAVAEAFAQGLRRGAAVRDPAAWAWRSAFRIADGMLAERGRSRARHRRDDDLVAIAGTDVLPDDVVALLDSLTRLSDDDRRLVVLALVGGLDAAEIGSLVGARAGTVRVRLHRARSRLRSILETDSTATATSTPAPSQRLADPTPPHPGGAR